MSEVMINQFLFYQFTIKNGCPVREKLFSCKIKLEWILKSRKLYSQGQNHFLDISLNILVTANEERYPTIVNLFRFPIHWHSSNGNTKKSFVGVSVTVPCSGVV